MPELIKESDLLIGDMLGSGSFGHVYKGKWKNREVAVKFVLRTKRSEVECIDKLLALKHSHLVTILWAFTMLLIKSLLHFSLYTTYSFTRLRV